MSEASAQSLSIDDRSPWGSCAPDWPVRMLLALTRHTPLGRGWARWRIRDLLLAWHKGPLDCDFYGQPMRAYLGDNRCEWKAVLNPEKFDPHERRLIAAAMDRPNAVMLDIGANVGIHALSAARHARADARIVAFEPHPVTFRRLAFNLNANPFNGFTALQVALGDREDTQMISGADLSLATLAFEGAGPLVRVRPLLDCLAELGVDHIDVMKIDVEGYEEKVLKPFLENADARLMPGLVIMEELARGAWSFDCTAEFVARGLRIIGRDGNNVILAKPDMNVAGV